ncbi:HET-domain-containing protein [Ophiobolus disseminans]|uniref:HET-domain-containing protein n=1 Tax=Ophiobolus disseminans TaxID=1469910 RepID=A0A6A6ZQX9_9PLEO|nr:HET-domain-containing protein [Ophiobolus disseminans]
MTTASDLCSTCQLFDLHSFQRDIDGYRGYVFDKVTDGAQKGCRFCTMLHDCFKAHRTNQPYIHLKLDQKRQRGSHALAIKGMVAALGTNNASKVLADVKDMKRSQNIAYLNIVADPESPAALTQDVEGRYHVDYNSLDYYISKLSERVTTCLEHVKCCKRMSGSDLPSQGNGMLPTRCLELCEDQVFLRETGDMCGSYLTLSHRWNQETEDTRTTMSNYEARLHGIWDCTLPKLYTDVLALAHRLGVRYAWIDSMCIIQAGDGGNDWRQEATKMAPYYQGSLMTVLANSATREHGLYPKEMHTPSPVELVRLPYRNREGHKQGYFFVLRNILDGNGQYHSAVMTSNLMSRGWVFQEYHLSRRSVCFTPRGMFFECKTSGAINDRIEGTETSKPEYRSPIWYLKRPRWYSYLSQYSGLHLTKPAEDRLVALSSVMGEYLQLQKTLPSVATSRQQPSLDDEDEIAWWHCGLWKYDLITGIMWQVNTSTTISQARSLKYPSWSWASTEAPVSWDGLTRKGCNMLQTIKLRTQSDGPLTSSDQGTIQNQLPVTLHAKGQLVPVLVRSRFESQRDIRVVSKLSNSTMATGLDEDFSPSSNWRGICLPGSSQTVSGWSSIEDPDLQDDSAFVQGPVIYALALSCADSVASPHAHGKLYGKTDVYSVLFLRSVLGGEQYRRVGVGRLYGDQASAAFGLCHERALILV